jgi:hypothetical protein
MGAMLRQNRDVRGLGISDFEGGLVWSKPSAASRAEKARNALTGALLEYSVKEDCR